MSKDLELIKAEATRRIEMNKLIEASDLNVVRSELAQDFDLIAKALNGDTTAKFGAFRRLVQRFGRLDAYELILAASEKSHYQWHISIRKRTYAERPDGGKRVKRWEKEFRTNDIGSAYYNYRIVGLNDREAIKKTRELLRLNLSDRTFKQELHVFRRAAKQRGYVDAYAVAGSFQFGHYKEPRILVADLTRKGRPKKNIQKPPTRNDLFPKFRLR